MCKHQRNVGWRDAADAFGLVEILRANARELFSRFVSQRPDTRIVERIWNSLLSQPVLFFDFHLLTRDIALVLDVIQTLLRRFAINLGQPLNVLADDFPIDSRDGAGKLPPVYVVDSSGFEKFEPSLHLLHLVCETMRVDRH